MSRTPTFTMLVGLPGSGKSTYALEIAKKSEFDTIIYSSDEIREELSGDVNNQKINSKVFEVLHERVKDSLSSGHDVIYDATNINSKRRRVFVEHFLRDVKCVKRCVIIATPYETCVVQNQQRDRVVPEYVIDKMYKGFETPYFNEGWDDISIVYPYEEFNGCYGDWNRFISDTIDYDQMNSHHTATLGTHCQLCKEYVEDNKNQISYMYDEMVIAAALHDCGKPYTQGFFNSKGEETADAHYYSHHNVGAYNSFFYAMDDGVDKLYVSALICWHMMMHFYEKWSTKTQERYKAMLMKCDNDFWNNLNILHKGDKYAH